MAYLKTLEGVLELGQVIGHNAMSRTKELQLVLACIQRRCPEHFRSCFEARGWLAIEMPEIMADWAMEPELGPSSNTMERLAHEVVGAYKGTYYAQRRAEANRVAAKRSREVEAKSRKELTNQLAKQ